MRLNELTSGARMCRVVDGDTLVVRVRGKEHRIRLYGIDAPERGQPYYKEAKDYLESIVDEQAGLYKMVREKSYRRTVAIVYSGINRDESVNIQMLRSGYAYYCPYSGHLNGGEEALQEAKWEKRGMWASESQLQKPWDYRAGLENEPTFQDPGPVRTHIEVIQPRQSTLRHQQKPEQRHLRPQSDKPTRSGPSLNRAIAIYFWLVFLLASLVCLVSLVCNY